VSLGGPGGDADAVVAALRVVAGVADAHILPDEAGGPGTLRLQLEPGADEVRVAADVHRLLLEQFGLGVDAGRVRIVEESQPRRGAHARRDQQPDAPELATAVLTAPEPTAAEATTGLSVISSPNAQPRLLIERMQLETAQLGVAAEITLGLRGRQYTGRAEAAASPGSVNRAVAEATLRAVEAAVGPEVRFSLEHLATAPMGGERAYVAEVSVITRGGLERLTGVSSVREDPRQAVVRATLDALNRRVESYLQSL